MIYRKPRPTEKYSNQLHAVLELLIQLYYSWLSMSRCCVCSFFVFFFFKCCTYSTKSMMKVYYLYLPQPTGIQTAFFTKSISYSRFNIGTHGICQAMISYMILALIITIASLQ